MAITSKQTCKLTSNKNKVIMKKINNQAVKAVKVVIANKKTMTELTCVRMKTYSPKIVTLMIRWRLSQNKL